MRDEVSLTPGRDALRRVRGTPLPLLHFDRDLEEVEVRFFAFGHLGSVVICQMARCQNAKYISVNTAKLSLRGCRKTRKAI